MHLLTSIFIKCIIFNECEKEESTQIIFDLLQKEGRLSQKRLENTVIEDNRRDKSLRKRCIRKK